MKSFKCLTIAVMAFAVLPTVQAQVSNADSLVHKVFTALKTKDENAFLALYPSKEETIAQAIRLLKKQKQISEDFIKADSLLSSSPDFVRPNFDSFLQTQIKEVSNPEIYKQGEAAIKKMFLDFIDAGRKQGIEWSKAHLIKYEIDSINATDTIRKILNSPNHSMMKAVLHFSSNNNDFKLSFDKIMSVFNESEWYTITLNHIVLENENLPKDEFTVTIHSIEAQVNEPPPPPPPPAKPKQKTKTKSSTTKSKTKTKS